MKVVYSVLWLLVMSVSMGSGNEPDWRVDEDTGIRLRAGFEAERLYSVPKEQGSWVAMTFDPKGRLIVSDQDDKGMFRVTLAGEKNDKVQVEALKNFPIDTIDWGKRRVGGALGFLYAFDSLYMTTMKGFFRVRDTDGDDQYDDFQLLKKLTMGYEHSAHSAILTEDGKGIYLVSGNYGRIPADVPSAQPPVWEMDSLLPMMPDAMGHASRVDAPGGWICRISPDGKDWRMIASGFRNCVDMAINREGELFTYDSDLEFDIGCPWYRPTRVNHVISGGEYGWRKGTGKWPEYSADSFGAVLNVGPGSPTGMSFGHHSGFPSQYQDKLFICDWTFGTIYTVTLTEGGSSYTGTKEEFLTGSPLNIAAMQFGPDGHMYFLVGGRNTQSALYRIRYTGAEKKAPIRQLTKNQSLRDLRHSLEALHGTQDDASAAVEKAWPYLDHADRAVRYAARIAIENQPISSWQSKALREKSPRAVITAAIALCRHAEPALGPKVLSKLGRLKFSKLDREDQLGLLRAYSLCFIRMQQPSKKEVKRVIAHLNPHYPADDTALNTEFCRVLSYLDAPDVVKKTVRLMKDTHHQATDYNREMLTRHEYGQVILKSLANSPNVQNIQYAYSLRVVKNGWTLKDREYYLGWLSTTLKKSGGKSFSGHVRAIRKDAIGTLTSQEAEAVSWLLGDIATVDLSKLPQAKGPAVNWTHKTATDVFAGELKNRNYENGKKMFSAGMCVACHRIQGEGGYSAPDLGSVGQRYSITDILRAIIEPSESISEQYIASDVVKTDGSTQYGRLIYKDKEEVALAPSAFTPGELVKIPVDQVKSIKPSNFSMMPPATINTMSADELKDLMAYLLSGGNRTHKVFQSK